MSLIIKAFGIISVFCAFSFFGFLNAFKLKKRRTDLSDVIISLQKIPEYIEIYESESGEILKEVMPKGVNLYTEPVQFEKGVCLNAEDKLLLSRFAKNFGMATKPDERKKCEAFLSLIKERYEEAKTEEKEKSKLYNIGGVLLGLTAVILML